MKTILQKDVTNLGREGDVVRVTAGYFRNFLYPNGFAIPATSGNVKDLSFKKKKIEAVRAEKRTEAEALAAKLKQVALVIRHRCGEKGQLFGSVTTTNIADALLGANFEVDRRKVVIHEPIKHIGQYTVTIRVYPEVNAGIKLTVKPEEDQEREIMERIEREEKMRREAEESARKIREAEEAAAAAAAAAEASGEGAEASAE